MARHPLRLLTLLAVSVAAIGLATPAQSAVPSCGITWGSHADVGSTTFPATTGALSGVRAGRHDCFDRLVLDVRGVRSLTTWRAEYVSAVSEDPTGNPVALRGGAFLQVTIGANQAIRPTRELAPVSGFTTLRQVAAAGSFEGLTTLGVGVRARLPFRVLTVTGIPGSADGVRLVLDVAHRW